MHSEQRKEVPRHRRSLEPLGFDAFGDRQASIGIGGEAREAARLRLPVAEVLIRDLAAIAGARDLRGIQHREAFGLLERQRPQRDAVGDAENRAVDADPQRQAQNDQRGKAGAAEHASSRVPQVLNNRVHGR